MPLVNIQYSDYFSFKGEQIAPEDWYTVATLREASEAEVAEMQRLMVEYEKLQTLLKTISERPEFDVDNIDIYPLKTDYNTYNDFINAATANGYDVDRQFLGIYNQKGDLVGKYMYHPGPGCVTVKALCEESA